MNKTIKTVYSYPMESRTVKVLYVEYAGGADVWEFQVVQAGKELHTSENGYGQPEAAASAGFKWLLENADGSAFNVANIIQDRGSE
jgi:predicted secreted protein